jgi:hypothetical protein
VNIIVSAKMKWALPELFFILKVCDASFYFYHFYFNFNYKKSQFYSAKNSEPTNVLLFGNKAPEKESYEDICGPLQTCPECQEKYFNLTLFSKPLKIMTDFMILFFFSLSSNCFLLKILKRYKM